MKFTLIGIISCFLISGSLAAEEEAKGTYGNSLLGGYSFGVEFAPSASAHFVKYETANEGPAPSLCKEADDKYECYNFMKPRSVSNVGFFITKQYVPDGWLILDYGFDFSFHRYSANLGIANEDFTLEEGTRLVANDVEQPLSSMELDALSVATRLYGKAGFSPPFLPDIILTTGVGIETMYGTLMINDKDYTELMWAPHFFIQYELVWARFWGKGSLSSYVDIQFSVAEDSGIGNIETDGMSQFALITSNATFGIMKLVFPM